MAGENRPIPLRVRGKITYKIFCHNHYFDIIAAITMFLWCLKNE